MKRWVGIIAVIIFISCGNSDDSNDRMTTDISLVTGVNLRQSEFSDIIQLGNPNIHTNNEFITFPNPPTNYLNFLSQENITDIWIVAADAEKIYQQTDFNSVLNSNLYSQGEIESNSIEEFINLNSSNLTINVENLTTGYYRVFVKINEALYWDNIFIPAESFGPDDMDDLVNYWN